LAIGKRTALEIFEEYSQVGSMPVNVGHGRSETKLPVFGVVSTARVNDLETGAHEI
jgi:hypothetical protein